MTTKADTVKETLEVLEEANDVIEDTLDTIEAVKKQRDIFGYSSVAFIAASLGAVVAVYFTKKHLQKKYDDIATREIEEARSYYLRMAKPASPTKLAQQYADEQKKSDAPVSMSPELAEVQRITASYQSDDVVQARAQLEEVTGQNVEVVVPKEEDGPVLTQNVFQMADPGTDNFNYDEEMAKRSEEEPYVISHDEFMAGEKDYQQVQLTYYEGDDVLTDEKDQVIDDEDTVVGSANLLRFGHGSKDNNIVYVRNDRLTLEFEVVKSHGKFVEQVLGFIEHSERDDRPRKFRVHDE